MFAVTLLSGVDRSVVSEFATTGFEIAGDGGQHGGSGVFGAHGRGDVSRRHIHHPRRLQVSIRHRRGHGESLVGQCHQVRESGCEV